MWVALRCLGFGRIRGLICGLHAVLEERRAAHGRREESCSAQHCMVRLYICVRWSLNGEWNEPVLAVVALLVSSTQALGEACRSNADYDEMKKNIAYDLATIVTRSLLRYIKS